MNGLKKLVLGLAAAAGIAGATGVGVQGYNASVRLEDLCKQNGVHLEKGKDPRQSLLEQGFIYEPKSFWELSSEPRCFLKSVGQEGNVQIGTSYGSPFLVGINGIGLHEAWGLTTDDGKRAIVDEFPVWYDALMMSVPCEEQKNPIDKILLCNFFQKYDGTSKDRSQELFNELKRVVVAHERQHSEDLLSVRSYSGMELETRAYLRGLMLSPLGFLLLQNKDSAMRTIADKVYGIFDSYNYVRDGHNRGRSLGISDRLEIIQVPHDRIKNHVREFIANVYGDNW